MFKARKLAFTSKNESWPKMRCRTAMTGTYIALGGAVPLRVLGRFSRIYSPIVVITLFQCTPQWMIFLWKATVLCSILYGGCGVVTHWDNPWRLILSGQTEETQLLGVAFLPTPQSHHPTSRAPAASHDLRSVACRRVQGLLCQHQRQPGLCHLPRHLSNLTMAIRGDSRKP